MLMLLVLIGFVERWGCMRILQLGCRTLWNRRQATIF